MRSVLLTILLLNFATFWLSDAVFGQENTDKKFVELFYLAKDDLSHGRTSQALAKYKQLYKLQPENRNINYLLGVSYIFENAAATQALTHLEFASKQTSMEYDPSSHEETTAPIFVYYYMVVAYSQNGMCTEAKAIRKVFMEHYGEDKQDLYTHDADNWIKICEAAAPPPENTVVLSEVVTKEVTYSTPMPLFGVQVGSFRTINPYRVFAGLKNVEAFLSNDGTIRYVVGHFSFRSQAESLLEVVQAAGYEDAFIVDVNKRIRFGTELISINYVSVKGKYKGEIEFRVQIGAFKETIPLETAQQYLAIDGIREMHDGDLTTLTVGSFETYSQADAYRQEMVDSLQIQDAFIVAFNNGMKLDIKTARHYTDSKEQDHLPQSESEKKKGKKGRKRKLEEEKIDDEDFSKQ